MKHSRTLMRLGMTMALFAVVALAQDKPSKKQQREEAAQRAVSGIVTDSEDKPAPHAVVQLKDMRSLAVRSFITEDDGAYHFTALKSDIDYQLTARFNGMTSGSKTLSTFDGRKQAILNFKVDKKEKE